MGSASELMLTRPEQWAGSAGAGGCCWEELGIACSGILLVRCHVGSLKLTLVGAQAPQLLLETRTLPPPHHESCL